MGSNEDKTRSAKQALTDLASRRSNARYWIGGLAILVTDGVLLSTIAFGPSPGICGTNAAATVLAVAFALGTGLGFLGGEASVHGNADVPALGKQIVFSLTGGIAAFAITAWIASLVVDKNCPKPPEQRPIACSAFSSDGTRCTHCVALVEINGLGVGKSALPVRCESMGVANVRAEFTALMRVDQKPERGRQAGVSLLGPNGASIDSKTLVDDQLFRALRVSGMTRTDAVGTVTITPQISQCIYNLDRPGDLQGTCSADFAVVDIRAQ